MIDGAGLGDGAGDSSSTVSRSEGLGLLDGIGVGSSSAGSSANSAVSADGVTSVGEDALGPNPLDSTVGVSDALGDTSPDSTVVVGDALGDTSSNPVVETAGSPDVAIAVGGSTTGSSLEEDALGDGDAAAVSTQRSGIASGMTVKLGAAKAC